MFKPRNVSLAKQSAIIIYSNIVIFFDFLLNLYLANTLSRVFFPNIDDPFVTKIQVFGIFAVGYLARPLGGLIIGRYGDTRGRRPAFILISLCVVMTSLITACLPTYTQIGVAAPILFVTIRLVQGMGLASQSVLGWVFVSEHAPRRQLGFYVSLISVSFLVGVLFTKAVFGWIYTTFSPEALVNDGWRLIFLASALLSCVTLYLNHFLQETPAFVAKKSNTVPVAKSNNINLGYSRFHSTFLSTLFSFQVASLIVVVVLLLPKLILMRFAVDEILLNVSNIIGVLFFIMGSIFYGMLADRGHVGRALMIGAAFMIAQALIFYYVLQSTGTQYIMVTYALLGFASGVVALPPIIMLQLFPTANRLTSVAVIYNTTYAIVGGLLPGVLLYVTAFVSMSPALYLVFVGIISFITGQYIYHAPKYSHLDSTAI